MRNRLPQSSSLTKAIAIIGILLPIMWLLSFPLSFPSNVRDLLVVLEFALSLFLWVPRLLNGEKYDVQEIERAENHSKASQHDKKVGD